jgi:NADPH2:quinone reductase
VRAIQCVEWGGPEKLVLSNLPVPQLQPGEIRIRVGAAGVNFPDGLIIQRKYQVQPELPFIPGTEVTGRVDAVATGSRRFVLASAWWPLSA